jgi:hypothetical protein
LRLAYVSYTCVVEAQCPYCGQPISRQEFKQIRARIEAEERARIGKIEQTLKDRFAREKAQAEIQAKATIEKARRDANKAAEGQIRALRGKLDETISQRLAAQRETLGKQAAEAIATERTKFFSEKQTLEQQLEEMKRRLQAKPAHQIGEPAEVDLFKTLQAAFPDDRISRVPKGRRGPDVIVEIFQHEAVIGSIVIDSKNHVKWATRFTEKLRADQIADRADFAILSSSVFPSGERQLAIRDGVIVAHPQRVVALVQLLRRQIIENHALKLNADERNSKAERLFAYIVSPEAGDQFDRLHKATDALIEIEVREVESHRLVWKKRGELLRDVQRVHEDLTLAIDAVISGAAAEPEVSYDHP